MSSMGTGTDRGTRLLRDPREDTLWFQRLPPVHKARLRREWEAEHLDDALEVLRGERVFRRCLLQWAGLFVVAHLPTGVGGLQQLLIVAAAGAGAGFLAWKLEGRPVLGPVLAALAFFGLEVLAVYARMGPTLSTGFVFVRLGVIAFGLGVVGIWLAREQRDV